MQKTDNTHTHIWIIYQLYHDCISLFFRQCIILSHAECMFMGLYHSIFTGFGVLQFPGLDHGERSGWPGSEVLCRGGLLWGGE